VKSVKSLIQIRIKKLSGSMSTRSKSINKWQICYCFCRQGP
jgi:hypothetical protein